MVIAPPTPPTLARPPGRRYDLIRENAFGFEANFTVVGQAINANKTGTCRDTCQSAPLETMTHALWGRGGEGEVGGGGPETSGGHLLQAWQRSERITCTGQRAAGATQRLQDSKIIGGVASRGGQMPPTDQDQKVTSRKATRTPSCFSYARGPLRKRPQATRWACCTGSRSDEPT